MANDITSERPTVITFYDEDDFRVRFAYYESIPAMFAHVDVWASWSKALKGKVLEVLSWAEDAMVLDDIHECYSVLHSTDEKAIKFNKMVGMDILEETNGLTIMHKDFLEAA